MRFPSMYFFKKFWDKYHIQLPTVCGGHSENETSVTVLWNSNVLFIERAWRVLMRDIMPPECWVELEAFTGYWTERRNIYLEPGGFLVTKYGTRRKLFTNTGKPRKLDERPKIRHLDSCIAVTYHKLGRLLYLRRAEGWLSRFIGDTLVKLGILAVKHKERHLLPEQVATLALAGAITGQIGGRAEIRYRRKKESQLENRVERYRVKRSKMSDKTIGNSLKHLAHYFSGGRVVLWISRVVYGKYDTNCQQTNRCVA